MKKFYAKLQTKNVCLHNYWSLIDSCQLSLTKIKVLELKAAWQIAAYERLPNVCVRYSRRAGLGVLRLYIVGLGFNMSSKKRERFVSVCKFEESITEEKIGGGGGG